MDYQNGKYGYPPYDEDPNAAGQDPNAQRPYRDDPAAYGANPSGYGQDASPYGTAYDGYPSAPADSYDPDYTAHRSRTNYGGTDPSYPPRASAGYGTGNEYAPLNSDPYAPQDAYAGTPADPYATHKASRGYPDSENAYDSRYPSANDNAGYIPRGNTARTSIPRSDDGYSYPPRSNTSRTAMPHNEEEYGYVSRGTTSRTSMPQDGQYSSRGNTSRTRYPQNSREYEDDDLYDREPRAPRGGKKKRSKFGKFMHALGLYLAQMPAKTLVVIGGTFAMALVAIILLAVLLPKSDRAVQPDNGQLALTDLTPTPSIAPTNTPAPTEAVTPTPELPTLSENISAAGTVSELMPDIQKRLVELGYMEEPEGGYTTKYGPTTKTAIRLFQVKNFDSSDDWDGIIGQGTYNLLMSDQAKAYYLTRGDGDDRTKVITKLVEDVNKLQNRLIELGYLTPGSATGLYGNTTVQAVQKFQEYHGLTPIDGKAGQATLKLIYSTDAMDATTGKANNKSKMSPTPGVSAGLTTPSGTTPTVTPSALPTVTPVP